MQSEDAHLNTAGDDSISEHKIAKALDAARSRVAQHELERIEIERAIAYAKEEEQLLQRLLDLRRGVISQVEGRTANERRVESPSSERTVDKGHTAVLAVIDELTTTGRSVHISELMRLLGERGIAIPGAGTQANLITHLRRDPRLVRPSRGMYGLAVWGLGNMTPGQRKVRKKRFKVTARKGKD